jgi:hypothetical protein
MNKDEGMGGYPTPNARLKGLALTVRMARTSVFAAWLAARRSFFS